MAQDGESRPDNPDWQLRIPLEGPDRFRFPLSSLPMSQETKSQVRSRVRRTLGELPASVRRAQSASLRERLEAFVDTARVRTLVAFWPTDREPDIAPLLGQWFQAGIRVLLPVVADFSRRSPGNLPAGSPPRIFLARFTGEDSLTPNRWGIREPAGPEVPAPTSPLVLVPAVAVDRTGGRIGHGFGYYDELLGPLECPLSVAVVFREQITSSLPREDHDRTVSVIITPDEVIRTASRA